MIKKIDLFFFKDSYLKICNKLKKRTVIANIQLAFSVKIFFHKESKLALKITDTL
jgi:hypothetical protein